MSLRRLLPIIPAAIFFLLAGFFAYRLHLINEGHAPNTIPSVMIDHPAPTFTLPPLFDGEASLNNASLKGHVTILNVFASWCLPCRAEHPFLTDIHKAGIRLVGINYKDKPADAAAWLAKMGNPYDAIGSDRDGRVGIDFGVYGVPETYLIDKNGVIRFKQTGPLTPEVIEQTLLPKARELSQ